MMDKQLIKLRFTKAIESYSKTAIVQQQIARKLIQLMMKKLPNQLGDVFEIGCGTGVYSYLLNNHFRFDNIILNDICPEVNELLSTKLQTKFSFLGGDAEEIVFPKQVELITSSSSIQWFDNREKFFVKSYESIQKGGFLTFSTFGFKNLKEIQSITNISLSYPSLEQLKGELLKANFEILYSEEELIELKFESPNAVLRHLKNTGVTGVSRQHWTKSKLASFSKTYRAQFSNESNVLLSFHPLYIIAQKK